MIKLKIIIIIITRLTTLGSDMLFTNPTLDYHYHNDLYYLFTNLNLGPSILEDVSSLPFINILYECPQHSMDNLTNLRYFNILYRMSYN
jgi:hypothetical protein